MSGVTPKQQEKREKFLKDITIFYNEDKKALTNANSAIAVLEKTMKKSITTGTYTKNSEKMLNYLKTYRQELAKISKGAW